MYEPYEAKRDRLLNAAVQSLRGLAEIAEADPELDDIAESFRYAVDGWGELIGLSEDGPVPGQRPVLTVVR